MVEIKSRMENAHAPGVDLIVSPVSRVSTVSGRELDYGMSGLVFGLRGINKPILVLKVSFLTQIMSPE